MYRESSTARDTRLLIIGVLLTLLSTVIGFVLMLWWADTVGAEPCVGGWRVDQTVTAIESSSTLVEPFARPSLYHHQICAVTPSKPPPPAPAPTVAPAPLPLVAAVPVAATAHPAAVEQWRPLVELLWHTPRAVEDTLTVIGRESAGCPTAAAYRGCVGSYLPRQNTTGCQARGLMQHCARYWQDRIEKYGIGAECMPMEATTDPGCNLRLGHAMWVDSGCSFYPHWSQTDHGTGRGC